MATYKVIQDIEADDKLLGPLSLRQFIYAGITVFCLYLCYFAGTRGALFLLPIFLVPGLISGFFAFPWGKEQPTELWALARLRFMIKPKKRVWDQTGMRELVTITVPKRIEKVYTDGLSETEVKSRLQTLASTIDSRGWAIKNPAMGPYATTPVITSMRNSRSDRLIEIDTTPMNIAFNNFSPQEDVLDPANNPKAQQFDSMLQNSAQAQRQRLVESMQRPDNEPPAAFSQATPPQPSHYTEEAPQPIDEQSAIDNLRERESASAMQYSHLPDIPPLSQQKTQQTPGIEDQAAMEPSSFEDKTPATPPVTAQPDAAILELAHNHDDWNIATVGREAKRAHGEEPDEVVIPLH